jgi:hypothetical protein
MTWTKDPIEAFKAFINGKKVSYCRPYIDYDFDYEIDEDGFREDIQIAYYHEIGEYSSLFIFLNKESKTDEEATVYQIEEK